MSTITIMMSLEKLVRKYLCIAYNACKYLCVCNEMDTLPNTYLFTRYFPSSLDTDNIICTIHTYARIV